MGVGIAMIFGLSLGLFLSFLRSFINNNDIEERKNCAKVKNYVRKKIISFTKDIRITGIFCFNDDCLFSILFESSIYLPKIFWYVFRKTNDISFNLFLYNDFFHYRIYCIIFSKKK